MRSRCMWQIYLRLSRTIGKRVTSEPFGIGARISRHYTSGWGWMNLTVARSTAGSGSMRPMMRPGDGHRQELAMKVRIQVVIESENGEPEKVEEIARLE